MFRQEQNRSVAAVLGVGSIAVCVFPGGVLLEPECRAHF
jgi:hypothetical protein